MKVIVASIDESSQYILCFATKSYIKWVISWEKGPERSANWYSLYSLFRKSQVYIRKQQEILQMRVCA